MKTLKLIAVLALFSCMSHEAEASYAPLTVSMVTDSNLTKYFCVKGSTTANHVTVLLHTDGGALMVGIAQNTVAATGTATVLALQGVSSKVVSDGTGIIAAGDLIDLSSTVDGEVMRATNSPTPDGNTICTALTGAAAVPGTVFSCL